MAGRTGIGIGLGSFITILSITWVGLFVTTVAFMAKGSAARRQFEDLQKNNDQYITEGEKASDEVKQMQRVAGSKQSLTKYLLEQQRTTMRLASGNEKMSIEELQKAIDQLPGGKNSNLLQVLRDRVLDLTTANKRLDDAIQARDQALQDRQAEVARVAALEENYRKTMDAARADVEQYKGGVDANSRDLEAYKRDMEARVDKIRSNAQDELAELNARISDLEKEVLLGRDTVARLQAELKGRSPSVTDEYALVDARIIGINGGDNTVYLDVGTRKKAVLGLTFEVYNDASSLRPNAISGDYPAGKASLEIIKVDRESSIARITRETRGNPIVKGDVVANAVYDPNKVYTMLVYGNFDANRDGVATQQEAEMIRSLINEWGGRVVDDLEGSVDFLILGQKPTIPPAPPQGSPVALIQEYIRVKKIADRYDELLRQAQATSLPVLNENRLYTLIGKSFGL